MYGTPQASDWQTVNSTLLSCKNEWLANSRDAGVQAAVSKISASMITSANLDQQSILATLQGYQPNFQQPVLTEILTFIGSNQSSVPTVLSGLQTNGMSHYIGSAAVQAGKIAILLGENGDVLRDPQKVSPEVHYDCEVDGMVIFLCGIAFAVLTVMTLGADAVLIGAAWEGIAVWGGLGATGWGVGHVVAGCGF